MALNDRLLQGYDLGNKVSQLHGHARLELAREKKIKNRIKREVVNRIESDNTVTGYIGDALSAGNFYNKIASGYIYPLHQWFDGCYLTDVANDASLSMLAGNATIIAQSGSSDYTGTNTKRGRRNINESTSGMNSGLCFIRNVFDWGTSEGNGQISSVCLTRGDLGGIELRYNEALSDNANSFPVISSAFAFPNRINALDYKHEKAYRVLYSSGTITVDEYNLNTKRIHLLGGDMGFYLSTTHSISQTVSNYSVPTSSTFIDSDGNIHLFTWGNSGTSPRQVTVYDYLIDVSTWTVTATTYVFQGIYFSSINQGNSITFNNRIVIDDNGYMWSQGYTEVDGVLTGVIAKCNTNNVAQVKAYTDPRGYSYSETANNGAFVILGNGNLIKGGHQLAGSLYIDVSNEKLYNMYLTQNEGYYNMYASGYGTVIQQTSQYNYEGYSRLEAMFPFVSTVNNLSEAVEKRPDLTMKLTYEITEVNPS